MWSSAGTGLVGGFYFCKFDRAKMIKACNLQP